jgi:tRNA G18 (ribose-2'-O)-methylase SpoU
MPEFIEINDLNAPGCEVFTKLTEAQLRNRLEPEKGIFIAESPKVIDLAISAGCELVSILTEKRCLEGCASGIIQRCGDIPVYLAPPEVLSQMTGYKLNRGVLCAVRRPKPRSAEEICRNAHRIAVLENIVDSTNIGAAFRSAAALGIDAVLVTPSCCDPLLRRSVRVSMGTVLLVPWAVIGEESSDWPGKGIEQLHSWGFRTAAMALSDRSVSIDDPDLAAEDKLAIVLGTEGDGLSSSTIANCDYTVKIPMSLGVDSLNVAAAGAVAFWELRWRGER